MKTVTIEYPDQLDEQLRKLVEAGWFKTPEEGVVEALRRYLSGHSVELQEKQIMADVEWVVVPSIWWENSPLVIQEAFAHGRPVICSDIGGMAEKVADGVSGLHFRVNDPVSLADTIRRGVHSGAVVAQVLLHVFGHGGEGAEQDSADFAKEQLAALRVPDSAGGKHRREKRRGPFDQVDELANDSESSQESRVGRAKFKGHGFSCTHIKQQSFQAFAAVVWRQRASL